MVKVLQLNVQSLNKNLNTLNYYINNNNIDICILSEIFEYNYNVKLTNFKIIAKTRPDNYGGVAILIKNEIQFRQLNFNTNLDILIIETLNLKSNFTIASAYFPPNMPTANFTKTIHDLIDYLDNC